ncbi:MAG: DUF4469 domain-containing protein [Treponema sp.]|jgi:hypothetical protein|nr:DUF4469 domain-containing protein [Treponema sp.]
MAILFKVKDKLQKLSVRFIPAFLPEAKKPFNMKVVDQTELDIHDVASKADVYNVSIDPLIIEQGATAFFELVQYLTAAGYKIVTPFFISRVRVPGEYDGTETHLSDDNQPVVRIKVNPQVNRYMKEHIQLVFAGREEREGRIGTVIDEKSGHANEVCTLGNILNINGKGLKIDSNDENKDKTGVFFCKEGDDPGIKAELVPVNEPRTLKVIVPQTKMEPGTAYTLKIVTQASPTSYASLLKKLRTVTSDFTLTAVAS